MSEQPSPEQAVRLEELLAALYLYIDWRYVTKQLTTPQRELFADILDAHRPSPDEVYGPSEPIERWWRSLSNRHPNRPTSTTSSTSS